MPFLMFFEGRNWMNGEKEGEDNKQMNKDTSKQTNKAETETY